MQQVAKCRESYLVRKPFLPYLHATGYKGAGFLIKAKPFQYVSV